MIIQSYATRKIDPPCRVSHHRLYHLSFQRLAMKTYTYCFSFFLIARNALFSLLSNRILDRRYSRRSYRSNLLFELRGFCRLSVAQTFLYYRTSRLERLRSYRIIGSDNEIFSLQAPATQKLLIRVYHLENGGLSLCFRGMFGLSFHSRTHIRSRTISRFIGSTVFFIGLFSLLSFLPLSR